MLSVIWTLLGLSASASTFEVPLSSLFQYSPMKLGRSINTANTISTTHPRLIFKREIQLNQMGEAALGEQCKVSTILIQELTSPGYFHSLLNVAPGGKIPANASYEMRLISDQQDVLKIKLLADLKTVSTLELTCTHSNIQDWTVSEFESEIKQVARVYASAKFALLKRVAPHFQDQGSVNTMKGSRFNGLFGSGLPGTTGIELLLGANLKAYAEESNATLVHGKQCKLVSQNSAAFNDQYIKGSKFAFREYRVVKPGNVELIFDNWNHSPHQLRVECQGDLSKVKQMSLAQVEHDLNGTIQFYHK